MATQYSRSMMLVVTAALGVMLMAPFAVGLDQTQRLLCNQLPTDHCAFAVDSWGRRCVLETISGGVDWHVCLTSDIIVGDDSPLEYIETQQCLDACGVSSMTVGLSTDSLDSYQFTSELCSFDCQENCSNLVDLYSTLANEEGSSLLKICSRHQRRRMEVVQASGGGSAPGPARGPSTV